MRFSIKPRHASLRVKLFVSFTGMVLLLAAAGGAGLFSVRSISGQIGVFSAVTVPLVRDASALTNNLQQMHVLVVDAMALDSDQEVAGGKTKLEAVARDFDAVFSRLRGIAKQEGVSFDFEAIVAARGQLPPLLDAFFSACQKKIAERRQADTRLADFEKERGALDQLLAEFSSQSETAMNAKEDAAKTLTQSGNATVEDLSGVLETLFAEDYPLLKGAAAMQRYLMQMQDLARAFLAEKEEAKLSAIAAEFDKIAAKAASRLGRLGGRGSNPAALENLAKGFKSLQEKVTGGQGLFAQHRASLASAGEVARIDAETEGLLLQIQASLDVLNKKVAGMSDETNRRVSAGAQRSLSQVSVLVLAGIVIGFVTALLITRSIAAPIQRVVQDLDHDADRVAGAAEQVALAGHSLAKGASEQAASLEEVSASLEEMAAMTQQNADHARQGSALMADVNRVVEQANSSMQELTTSMNSITKASEETSKIVKTIEEIAFQTNLLALNAAVEAARAGEAGAGFAVVAGEVRNLAMRASEAAKNTALLIEDTIGKVKGGGNVVSKSAGDFARIMESTAKLGELIDEIARASDDQAKGVGQINQAITSMDGVVQASASNAEQSAALADEMKTAASEMKGVVGTLEHLVKGGGNPEASHGKAGQLLLAGGEPRQE